MKNQHRKLTSGVSNGVLGQVDRYLNTLGSWSTYRDISRPEDIPKRLAGITAAFFGIDGLGGNGLPRLTGILGAIMAVHALEQVTGAAITFGVRLLARGEPLGHAGHRGVILRQSPFTPHAARAWRWLIGSRLVAADGYYFFESGRTWHSQTVTVDIWDTSKTLTHVRSFSLPYREYYFDREVSPQSVVDVIKGDRAPNAIPGFIGSVNELENVTSLGHIKRAFIAANWLLIDEGERDDGGPCYGDYDAFIKGNPSGGGGLTGGSSYRPLSPAPSSGPGGYHPGPYGRQGNTWPSTTSQAGGSPIGLNNTVAAAHNGTLRPIPLRPVHEPAGTSASNNTPPPPDEPYLRIKARYQGPDGRLCPLLIRGVATNPVTMVNKANAIYYDSATKRWREITDDRARIALAKEVEAGNLKVTTDWQHHL